MIKNNISESILYNNILLLSRKKFFYTDFNLTDTFQNRINLIFIHFSLIFIKKNQNMKSTIYKNFYQNLFDFIFSQVEINMREIGYGDVVVNKNMKFLTKTFYSILLYCENYRNSAKSSKKIFLNNYLEFNNKQKTLINEPLINYFNKFEAFCFDLTPDSVLKGEINFNNK
jgi:cytochrome b pre-mRNA-processing protein 3